MKGDDVPRSVLMHWYQCGRKRRFASEVGAVETGVTCDHPVELNAYQCPFADDGHWHVGRPKRAMPARPGWRPHDERRQQLRNARRTWDRIAYRSTPSEDLRRYNEADEAQDVELRARLAPWTGGVTHA